MEILHEIKIRMSEKISMVIYRAMRTDDPDIDGYYIVEWSFNVYTVEDDIFIKRYNSPQYAYTGEMVCKVRL